MGYIEINNVYYQYTKKNKAVDGVTLSIDKHEFVCILGHNGSGKSTLAKLLVGLLKCKKGSIVIDGIEINSENTTDELLDEVRKKVGIVFQNPDNQFVGVTVRDDIAFGLENRQIPHTEMVQKVNEYAKLVKMDKFMENNPEDLSGGEKQRVAIAGVLAANPEVIIFDEATSMLDPLGVNEVMELVSSLKNKRTIISITHNLREALLADKVVVMNDGKIVMVGTPQEVFKEKELLKDSKLDILESMKLIELIENSKIKDKEKIEEKLWELTYQR